MCPPRPPPPAYVPGSPELKIIRKWYVKSPHSWTRLYSDKWEGGCQLVGNVKKLATKGCWLRRGLCHTMVLQPFYPTLFYTDSYPFPLNVSALLCYDTPLLHPFHISQNMALQRYPASFQSAMKSTWRVWRAVNWCALVRAHLSKWKPFHRQPPVFFTGSPEYFVNCHQKYFVKCSPPLRIVTTWTPRRTLLKLWNCQHGHLRNLLYNEIIVA